MHDPLNSVNSANIVNSDQAVFSTVLPQSQLVGKVCFSGFGLGGLLWLVRFGLFGSVGLIQYVWFSKFSLVWFC